MSYAKELPKLVDKTAVEVSAILAEVATSNLTGDTKEFVISAINLSLWLPKALVEHQITVSNLRKLVFGSGESSDIKDEAFAKKESPEAASKNNDDALDSPSPGETESPGIKDQPDKKRKGHDGRLAHTAYQSATATRIAPVGE